MPDIMTALRSTLGTSFALLFITETFASVSGLGYFITNCMDRRNYEEMYAAIVMLALMGTILYALIGMVEKQACKWKFLQ
jgi:NitT/TauT family transport system permease protein